MPMIASDPILILTEAASQKMTTWLADSGHVGVRVAVVGGGCAGLQYQMDPAEAPNDDDIVQTIGEAQFFMHPMVIPYLKGLTIDYSDALVDGGFKFINPNATNTCGCGTSFGV